MTHSYCSFCDCKVIPTSDQVCPGCRQPFGYKPGAAVRPAPAAALIGAPPLVLRFAVGLATLATVCFAVIFTYLVFSEGEWNAKSVWHGGNVILAMVVHLALIFGFAKRGSTAAGVILVLTAVAEFAVLFAASGSFGWGFKVVAVSGLILSTLSSEVNAYIEAIKPVKWKLGKNTRASALDQQIQHQTSELWQDIKVLEGDEPFRSKPLGYLLTGLACLIMMIGPLAILALWHDEVPIYSKTFGLTMVIALAASVLAVKIAGPAYSLRSPSVVDLLRRDRRHPILYLRSFADDGRSGESLGVRQPALGSLEFLLNWSFWGLLQGVFRISFERNISQLLGKHYGPVIAIGQPGERLPRHGAARCYVSHDVWQVAVECLVQRSQLIVWQYGHTPGAHWELKRLVDLGYLRRTILIIPNPRERPDEFRRLHESLETSIPGVVPKIEGDANFLSFDAQGRCYAHPVLYKSTIRDLFSQTVMDIEGTFQFLDESTLKVNGPVA